MSLKIKAALQTVLMLLSITLIVFGLQELAEMLTLAQAGFIAAGVVLLWLAYIMYLIFLNRLEYEQKVDKLTKD